ncbi:hypothetical protein DL93DRAFT_2090489, partial [Clavulina sp. PMI_390]
MPFVTNTIIACLASFCPQRTLSATCSRQLYHLDTHTLCLKLQPEYCCLETQLENCADQCLKRPNPATFPEPILRNAECNLSCRYLRKS